jgi:FAD/FMN-containing dehydrogenase/Fe-S oxidoreductase
MTSLLYEELKSKILGEIHFDSITRHVYSVDASIFEVEPLGVILPKSREDLIEVMRIAYAYRTPVTARGAATGITGSCLGKGLIIDTSKYLNHILKIDIENEYVICEPGVVQDDLNSELAKYGYRLGPDTSTGNRATLGGMLANNAAGSRSLRYGKMVDHVLGVEVILADGMCLHLHSLSSSEWKDKLKSEGVEGDIYRTVWHLMQTHKKEIEQRFPKIPRRVSGYNLDELIKTEHPNLSKLIAGSEGTLGIISRMQLRIVPKAKTSGLCLLHFDDILDAFRLAPHLLKFDPMALELLDSQIIEQGRRLPAFAGQLNWLTGHPQALLIVEFDGSHEQEVLEKIANFTTHIQGHTPTILLEPDAIAKVWALRKAGLGILLSKRTYSRAIAFLEDISVPPQHLADFMTQFLAYLNSKGKTAGIYGHVGAGCMHIRPYINLRESQEIALMRQMMHDISDLLLKFGGALSGEHGDGLIRSWLNPKMFGERLTQAFIELKNAFDPHHLMNPGKIIQAKEPIEEELRLSPNRPLKGPHTFLNFEAEGGFELAADLCNGNGQCRKKTGVMCPSFQVTNDEFHSTRARAQVLRDFIQGRIRDFTSPGIDAVMDLCISCKGCKTECPSQVDMAKMKAEFLYHYQAKHGMPLRNYLFGYIGRINQWMTPLASLANRLSETWLAKKGLEWLGIAPQRSLPKFAKQTFSKWLKTYQPSASCLKQVVLFNDTFTEFNDPHIGQAAIQLLNQLGYEVIVPQWTCCGRPLISKGMLKQARLYAERTLKVLQPYILQNLPIIGLEPSCILTIKDDYTGLLLPELRALAEQAAPLCQTLDEFLAHHIKERGWQLEFKPIKRLLKVHGHCHQKALVGIEPTLYVLRSITGFEVSEIPSGCCGMAGSFGYEKEHYHISMQMGNLKLFPAILESPEETILVANGTSCRHQIIDGTARQALHLAELIYMQLRP